MTAKLLNEYHLEFLRLKGDCTGSSESMHVEMPHCWKSHALAHITVNNYQTSCAFHLKASNMVRSMLAEYDLLNNF